MRWGALVSVGEATRWRNKKHCFRSRDCIHSAAGFWYSLGRQAQTAVRRKKHGIVVQARLAICF